MKKTNIFDEVKETAKNISSIEKEIESVENEIAFYKTLIKERKDLIDLDIDFSDMPFLLDMKSLVLFNSFKLKPKYFVPLLGYWRYWSRDNLENFRKIDQYIYAEYISTILIFWPITLVLITFISLFGFFNLYPIFDIFITRKITTKRVLKRVSIDANVEYSKVRKIFVQAMEKEKPVIKKYPK